MKLIIPDHGTVPHPFPPQCCAAGMSLKAIYIKAKKSGCIMTLFSCDTMQLHPILRDTYTSV
jgi:hypothetical protein